MKLTRSLGMLFLSIFLILWGLAAITTIALPSAILAILAIVAGALILLGR